MYLFKSEKAGIQTQSTTNLKQFKLTTDYRNIRQKTIIISSPIFVNTELTLKNTGKSGKYLNNS